MAKKRLGKDITIAAKNITIGGTAADLTAHTFVISVRDFEGQMYLLPTSVDTGAQAILGVFEGKAQLENRVRLGEYVVSLWIDYGEDGQTVIDWTDVLTLVPVTTQETSSTNSDVTTSTIEVTGDADGQTSIDAERVARIAADAVKIDSTVSNDSIVASFKNVNGKELYAVTLPKATSTKAGLMSASDKDNLDGSYTVATVDTTADNVKVNLTTNGGTEDVLTLPAATKEKAGVMSAVQEAALESSFGIVGRDISADKVTLQLTRNDGTIENTDIASASSSAAGVMSATDKSHLDASVKSVTPTQLADNVTLTTTNNAGGTSTVGLGSATQKLAGVMTAVDKQNLDGSYSIAQVDTTADDVKLGLTTNDSTTDTLTIASATTSSAGVMSAKDKENLNYLKETVDNLILEDMMAYGIERGRQVSSPTCTRVGNMNLHKSLPVQSLMKGCLLDDNGNVTKYLDANDWTGETRDGSAGQVMVEMPRHWRKFYWDLDADTIGAKISLYPLNGYHEVKKGYMSAYEASLDRTNNKLASVVNTTAQYRGGNNNSAWDGTYRSLLGLPATAISGTSFRTYARNRKSGSTEWNMLTYDAYKTLYWLYVIEYANTNCQAAYNAELTTDGYKQGGLGAGVTELWKWGDYNSYYPCVPCGATDSLGNGTGVVTYEIVGSDSTTWYKAPVPRYRGIENPFGHIWKWVDGLLVLVSADEANGGTGLSKVYVCHDPAKFSSTSYADYEYVGDEARTNGYTKELIFGEGGEIMGKEIGAGTNTYYCDYHYVNIPTSGSAVRGVRFGGTSNGGAFAGLAYSDSYDALSASPSTFGSRLCFIPS